MFYCRTCKVEVPNQNCNVCGKALSPADEIVKCPNCKKMFFKPKKDFKCTRCATLVQVNNENPNMQANNFSNNQVYGNPNNNGSWNGAQNNPVNNFGNMQQNAYPSQNQANFNPTNMQNGYNQNAYQNPQNNFSENGFRPVQPQNQSMQFNQSNNQNFVNPTQSPQPNSNQNSYDDLYKDLFSTNNNQNVGVNLDPKFNADSRAKDPYTNLYNLGTNDQDKRDFSALREGQGMTEQSQPLSQAMPVVDQYEVVDISKEKDLKKEKAPKVKAGKGLKVFAIIELFIIIAGVIGAGYYFLSPFILKTPVERYFSDYVSMQSINGDIIYNIEEESYEKYMIASLKYNEGATVKYFAFKIEDGLKFENFIDFSKAKFVYEAETLADVKAFIDALAV